MIKILKIFSILISILLVFYFGIGFYISYQILHIDHSCGQHQGSLPNTWSTKVNYNDIVDKNRIDLRHSFNFSKYHINEWENVNFKSRNSNIKIDGWLFNYYNNNPIVIVVHGIFPNGKCKSEPNLVASLLLKNKINALTIDLRNYGDSSIVSSYENLGLTEYQDVLGAFDYLKSIGFKSYEIGLMGISLGASTVIFAAANESEIKAIWSESSLAEFKMILKDEIARYGLPYIFGFAVSATGKILAGIDPQDLNPAYSLSVNQKYFFTHGKNDKRILSKHFDFIKEYSERNNINAEYWLVNDAGHVDSMLMFPEEYGNKMKIFFEKNLVK